MVHGGSALFPITFGEFGVKHLEKFHRNRAICGVFAMIIHHPFCNGIWLRWHSPHHPTLARILCHRYRIGRGTCIESIGSHRPNRPKFHYHQNEKSERSLDLDSRGREGERESINEKLIEKLQKNRKWEN